MWNWSVDLSPVSGPLIVVEICHPQLQVDVLIYIKAMSVKILTCIIAVLPDQQGIIIITSIFTNMEKIHGNKCIAFITVFIKTHPFQQFSTSCFVDEHKVIF